MKVRIGIVLFLAFLGALGYALFTGPHMIDQPIIKSYQAPMPLAPADSVPVRELAPPMPTSQAAAGMVNPLAAHATDADYAAGKVYYQYYCVSCHNDNGDGNGPVGQSFVPPIPDLRSPKLRAYSDGQLLRAILTGPGHKPALNESLPSVIGYTVLPEHRWYLELYVRSLISGKAAPATAPAK